MPDRPLVSRRTAVAGLAATFVVAGCDNGDEISPADASGSPSATLESPEAPEQTPDEALVDEVLAELTAALRLLAQARKVTLLRPVVTPVLRAHRRHVQVLEGELAHGSPPDPSPDPDAMLRLVRRGERDLQVSLVDAATRAESGALARLLASMSASVTQHLTLLSQEIAS